MKKSLSLFLALLMVLSMVVTVAAEDNVVLTGPCFATVVQVVDGATIKVKPYGTEDTALVRLVGVSAGNNPKAVTYLTDKIMGKLVSLTFDRYVISPVDRLNLMVVMSEETVINREMIDKGYASKNENHANAALFANASGGNLSSSGNSSYGYNNGNGNYSGQWPPSDMPFRRNGKTYYYMNNRFYEYRNGNYYESDEWFDIEQGYTGLVYYNDPAYFYNYGYWYDDYGYPSNNYYPSDGVYPSYSYDYPGYYPGAYYPGYYPGYSSGYYDDYSDYGGYDININTATATQLQDYLRGVSSSLARRIVEYREDEGYFNRVSDIKDVSGMTSSIYNQNSSRMVVVTNINTASRQELLTLKGIKNSHVDEIFAYRKKHRFEDIDELYEEKLISESVFEDIKDYIDVSRRSYVD